MSLYILRFPESIGRRVHLRDSIQQRSSILFPTTFYLILYRMSSDLIRIINPWITFGIFRTGSGLSLQHLPIQIEQRRANG